MGLRPQACGNTSDLIKLRAVLAAVQTASRAAWAGLTPKEHSTGGKQRMGGISRAGNERLRQLLVARATAVIRFAIRPGNKQATLWLVKFLQRRPAVALANKIARTARK